MVPAKEAKKELSRENRRMWHQKSQGKGHLKYEAVVCCVERSSKTELNVSIRFGERKVTYDLLRSFQHRGGSKIRPGWIVRNCEKL